MHRIVQGVWMESMEKQNSAMVYFGQGLPQESLLDKTVRERTLSDGTAAIVANVPGLEIVSQNRLACVAAVSGTPPVLDKLQRYIRDSGLGALEIDVAEKPVARAALKTR